MLAVVKPSMPGMRTSSRIAAKSSSSTLRSASSPELAVMMRGARGVFREMVQVRHGAARVDERARAHHHLRRELERDVEDLVFAPGAELAQEREVILDVLEDVDRHDDIEERVLVEQVGEPE